MAEPEDPTQRLGASDNPDAEPTAVLGGTDLPEPTKVLPTSPWAGSTDPHWAPPDASTRVQPATPPSQTSPQPTAAYPPSGYAPGQYPQQAYPQHPGTYGQPGQPGYGNQGYTHGGYAGHGQAGHSGYGQQGQAHGQPGYGYQGQPGYSQHPGYYQPSQYYYQPQPAPSSTKKRWPLAVVALLAAFVLVAGGFFWASRALIGALPSPTVTTQPELEPSVPVEPDQEEPGQQEPDGTTTGNAVTAAQSAGVVLIEAETASGLGAGTGMIISADGKVLTNYHVVAGSERLAVTIADTGNTYVATVLGFDQSRDVALLQLKDASGLTTVRFDDDSVSVGDEVAAVGNARGGGELVKATGEVTDVDQDLTVSSDSPWGNTEDLSGLIETNARAVPGYSGGPMFDAENEVIGITTAGSTRQRTSYTVPIEDALRVVAQIESGQDAGTVRVGPAGYLGIKVAEADQGSTGKTITEVVSGSPADQAGVTSGSRLTRVGDTRITARTNLASVIRALEPGAQVTIEWIAPNGDEKQATATLGSSPVN